MLNAPKRGRGRTLGSVKLHQQAQERLKQPLLDIITVLYALKGKGILQKTKKDKLNTGGCDGRCRWALDVPWGNLKAALSVAASLGKRKTGGSTPLQTACKQNLLPHCIPTLSYKWVKKVAAFVVAGLCINA